MSRFEGAIVRSEKGAKIRMILNYSNRKSKSGNVKSKKTRCFQFKWSNIRKVSNKYSKFAKKYFKRGKQ